MRLRDWRVDESQIHVLQGGVKGVGVEGRGGACVDDDCACDLPISNSPLEN